MCANEQNPFCAVSEKPNYAHQMLSQGTGTKI